MTEPLRILLLEDNPADVDLIKFELEEAGFVFTSKVVMSEGDYLRELQEYYPDIILSDYDLPKYSGALALAETNRRCPDTPFILVTGAVSEDRAIEILTQGAKDYVLKSRLQQRLAPAVRRALAEAAEHRARKQVEEELREAHRTLEKQVKERTSELQDSRERLRLAVTSSGMGIFEWDIVDNRRYFDDCVYHLLGIKPENFSGKAEEFFEVIHPDDRQAVQDALRKATEQDGLYETEYRAVWPDGSVHNISARGKVLRDSTGHPVRMLGVCWEVTDRKQAEEKLNRFELLAAYARDIVLFIRRDDGHIMEANAAAMNAYGYTREELAALTIHDLRAPDTKTLTTRQLDEAEKKGILFETIHQRNDGTLLPVEVSSRGATIGGVSMLISVIRDITERKKAEEALQERQTLLQAVINDTTDPIYIKDCKSRLLLANDALAKIVGKSLEEIIGRTDSEYYGDAVVGQTLRENDLKIMASGKSETIEEKVPTSCGSRVFLSNKAPYRNASGNIIGIIGISRDITERKRAEEALKQQSDRLDAANKELESFSYSVSHDLRAPLRAIDGYSRMILKTQGEQLDEETRRRLQMIQDNTKKMGRLIDDLLALSRFGSQAVTKKGLNMEELVSEVWPELAATYPDRKMTLKNCPMPVAWGDRSLVWQVYSNLLGNAAKFTQGREATLIEAGSCIQDSETVYYVRDNGIGFDMRFYDKLFGVFQRLHSDEDYKGTGIGLALVKRIINRHGGRIWAEGEVGKGATFYFTLPAQLE